MDLYLGIFLGFSAIASFLAIVGSIRLFLEAKIREEGEHMVRLNAELESYQNYRVYLRKWKRERLIHEVSRILDSINKILKFRFLLGNKRTSQLISFISSASQFATFLNSYIPDYVNYCKIEYADLFNEQKPPDDAQLEAIFKDDAHNLVVAAAGSGKTFALTNRIAFLVRKGIEPQKILALAYTKLARNEMERRLMQQYRITGVKVATFHSFGLRFTRMYGRDLRDRIVNGPKQRKYVNDLFDNMLDSRGEYAFLVLRFISNWKKHESQSNLNKRVDATEEGKYIAEDRTAVDSLAEWEIANFLFRNQVNYEHALEAAWAERSREHKQMEPDFTLTKYDICIENWGIDDTGEVAPWFRPDIEKDLDPTEKYKEEMVKKKEDYLRNKKKLIETFYSEYQNKTLIPKLEKQLLSYGVELRPLSDEQIREQIQEKILKEFRKNDPLTECIIRFINLGKLNGLSPSDVARKLEKSRFSQSQISFAKIAMPIWKKYQEWLQNEGRLDFNDMINEALKIARERKTQIKETYSHILIDEYQDITDNQVELIKCFLDPNLEKTSLFCVGDDWQNIFSFAGANVENIVEFDKDFISPERTLLETNYRCPKKIVDASNSSIVNNVFRIRKLVRAALDIDCKIFVCERPDFPFGNYDDWEEVTARQTIESIRDRKKANETVLVLSRYNYRLKYLRKTFFRAEKEGIRFRSIHGAKGAEADYVVILGCVESSMGFPTEIHDSTLFDLVRRSRGENEILEEERRLFYVALTRCKKEAYIFTSQKAKSRFVTEISDYLTSFGSDSLASPLQQQKKLP